MLSVNIFGSYQMKFSILISVALADVGIQIRNGTDAFPGQFPYMAAIRVRSLLEKIFKIVWQLLLAYHKSDPETNHTEYSFYSFCNYAYVQLTSCFSCIALPKHLSDAPSQ